MNFEENEIISAAMLGFDMIEGPTLKWQKTFVKNGINIDFEEFLMNFYLSFKGGNEGMKPKAILYDDFYIVAFPHGLELCALFLQPNGISQKLNHLGKIAEALILHMDEEETDEHSGNSGDYDEIKRIIVNMLRNQQLSTPEVKRHFKMTNSEIWKVMSELEESQRIRRTSKRGRAQLWISSG
ncbi:MAG: hypothetical protein ACTSWY_06220 [Promethearchaeota archaeon]